MSNFARKYQIDHREYIQEQVSQPITKTAPKKVKKAWLSPGEKVLGVVFSIVICMGGITIISNYASIYSLNKDYQDTNKLIAEQTKVNSELSMQVSELSEYDRIWAKAKEQGLNLNENNMKAVSGK